MKLKGTPLVLLVTAIVLSGAVYLLESHQPTTQKLRQDASNPLFAFQEAEVQAFTVETSQQSLAFRKTGTPDRWEMTAPQTMPAEAGAIAFLLNLMATDKSQQTLQIPKSRQAEFGFEPPLATVNVTLTNQQTQTLVLGKPTFDRSALYALTNPDLLTHQTLTLHLVSPDFASAVTRPLSEWQQAPDPKKK